jgi:hypothetical protein
VEREITGAGGAVTVRVTVIIWGLFAAPLAVSVIVPLYLFAVSPAGLIETVNSPGAVERLIHEALARADHVNVPDPEFNT